MRGFDRCALVCDIEGAELNLIRTEIQAFQSHVEIFIVELHPAISGHDAVAEIRGFLAAHGFETVSKSGSVFVFRNATILGVPQASR